MSHCRTKDDLTNGSVTESVTVDVTDTDTDAGRMRLGCGSHLLLWVMHLPRATRAGIVRAMNQEFGKIALMTVVKGMQRRHSYTSAARVTAYQLHQGVLAGSIKESW